MINPNSHHFFIVVGDTTQARTLIQEALAEANLPYEAHVDVYIHMDNTCAIADARSIKSFLSEKPVGEKKVCIIESTIYTPEAQQALLKTFEEPTTSAVCFLCIDDESRLLATVRSRAILIRVGENTEYEKEAKLLLSKTRPERLKHVESLFKKSDTEDDHDPIRHTVYMTIASLVRLLHTEKNPNRELLATLTTLASYVLDSGSPVKMLFETALLSIPDSYETK